MESARKRDDNSAFSHMEKQCNTMHTRGLLRTNKAAHTHPLAHMHTRENAYVHVIAHACGALAHNHTHVNK